MSKREAESPDIAWESPEETDSEDTGSEFGNGPAGAAVRLGFHLEAARKIEQARERRALRAAIEDFDDYVV
ncbi:MAG: hypothetical protein FJ170_09510 [Gammaproteobacteria bacterium]|nr:hypothetical protein [Gammaproteobacteria bacterium]